MLRGMVQEARLEYARAGMLFEVHLDLLYQCDLDCQHCYLDDKSTKLLSTDFWKDVIDQLAELQVFSLLLSGGEIFLRPDLFEIIAHARERGLFIQLKTHGGHLDDAKAARVVALGVSSITLSYYSSDASIHDAITRRPGSHAKTLAAIKRLAPSPVLLLVACSVMASNRPGMSAMRDEMRELGVSISFDGLIRVAQSGDDFPLQTALGPDELQELVAEMDPGTASGCEVAGTSDGWDGQKNCVAGHMSLYIGPEAEVFPCVTWPQALGDLKVQSLQEIWDTSSLLHQIRGQRRRDRPTCQGCALRAECSYCAGQGFLDGGDPMEPSPVICEATWAVAKANALRAGEPAPGRPPGLKRPRFNILKSGDHA
jgi:radical SAM protein with 4Fe4S-binding SPASM domain